MSKSATIQPRVASTDNPLPIVSCHKVYYAIKQEERYGTPVYLPNLTEIGIEKSYNSTPFYAEGVNKFTHSVLGDVPITLSTGDIEEEHEMALLGHKKDNNGLLVRSIHDVPADVAIMFTVEKAGGIYKGYVFYDGKFVPSGVTAATSEGSANYQPKTITGNFKPLDDGTVDASKTLKSLKEVESFFASVPTPTFE